MIFKLLKIQKYISRYIFTKFYTIIFRTKISIYKCRLGRNSEVNGSISIVTPKENSIVIGNNLRLNSRFKSNLVGLTNNAIFQVLGDGKIEIGNNCGFSSPVFSSRTLIKIGDYVMMGGNVRIFDHDYHSLNYLHRRNSSLDSMNARTSEVIIEDDVFIGTNAIILKGVHIGARSIIGAGSVVSLKRIPPDSLVTGNPAKVVKRINGKEN